MNFKTILIILGIIAAVVGFLILGQSDEQTSSDQLSSHTKGAGNSGVVLVEYGDFQCPACAQYYPILKQIKEEYGDRITFQFRHFPLEAIHTNARAASRAAEAAGIQGKFWEMHDHLFTHQSEWQSTNDPLGTFERYAQTVGVEDIEKFKSDIRSSEVNAVINADQSLGRSKGVSSTPTFLINDELIEPNPPASLEAFKALIDEALGGSDNQEDESNNETSSE